MMKRILSLSVALSVLLCCYEFIGRTHDHHQAPFEGSLIGRLSGKMKSNRPGFNSVISQDKPKYILMEVVPDLMKFKLDTFTVQTGQKIVLELDNLDVMQHNLLIGKPGTLNKIGEAADAMLIDPKASDKHYVPEISEVLFSTPLVDPGNLYALEFTAPKEPGNYPFVCTFPGHWRMMNGIMKVEKKE